VAWYALLYTAVNSLIALGWLTILVWAASRVGRWIRGARVRRYIDRMVGAVLIGLGTEVAVDTLSA
jgi:threonine/homoserine/homoserine lactone efflux protein